MKTLITLTVLALSATPVLAESAAEKFASYNTSAAERIVGDTSIGDVGAAKAKFALNNDSAAEQIVRETSVGATRAAQAFFALNNDSAAERIVK